MEKSCINGILWVIYEENGGKYALVLVRTAPDLLGELMQVLLVSGWCSDREAQGKHQSRDTVEGAPSM